MRKLRIISLALGAIVFALVFNPRAKASDWDKKTIVTFDQDVQIPGQVLRPGTYVFSLFNSSSDRFVVQVWDESGTQLLATLMTVPDYSWHTPKRDYFVLDRDEEGNLPELVSWFYPGEHIGREFVYPSSRTR